MSLTLQFKKLSAEELRTYAGAEGEIVINTTTGYLVLMDGVTPGGTQFRTDNRPTSADVLNRNRWLFNRNGILVDIAGNPIREIGFNVMEDLASYAGKASGGDKIFESLRVMARHGVRYIRAQAYNNFYAGDFRRYYKENPDYIKRFRAVLDACANNGIGVLLNFFWAIQAIPDYLNGHISEWGDPESAVFLEGKRIVTEFITEFQDHPAIAGWELTNEWTFYAEFGNTPTPVLQADGVTPAVWNETKASYSKPIDQLSVSGFQSFLDNMSAHIASLDPHGRIITDGHGGRSPGVSKRLDTLSERSAQYTDNAIDTYNIHQYHWQGSSDLCELRDFLIWYRQQGAAQGKPMILGEFGVVADGVSASQFSFQQQMEKTCAAIYNSGTQLSFQWIWRDRVTEGLTMGAGLDETRTELLREYRFWQRKMRLGGYIDPDTLELGRFTDYPRPTGTATSDGTGSIQIDMSSLARTDGYCFAFWYKPGETILGKTLLSWTDNQTNNGVEIYFPNWAAQNMLNYVYWADGSTSTPSIIAGPWDTNEWMHIVIQLDTNNTPTTMQQGFDAWVTQGLRVFFNGRMTYSTRTGKAWNPATSPLTLFDSGCTGSIADFKILNRSLTSEEVRSMYLHNREPAHVEQKYVIDTIVGAKWDFTSLTDVKSGIAATSTGGITLGNDWQEPDSSYKI